MAIVSDLVRDFLVANIATDYLPTSMWQEDRAPFTERDNKIIYVRQEGRPVDAMIREHDLTVYMFSKAKATGADLQALRDEIEATVLYVKDTNFEVNDNLLLSLSKDLSGPYRNGQDRYFYQFNLLSYSE